MRLFFFLLTVGLAVAKLAPLRKAERKVTGSYIIKFKDDVDVDTTATNVQSRVLKRRFGHAKINSRYYKALKGMAVELSDAALEFVRNLDEVEFVEEDGVVEGHDVPWGLDRINQRYYPFDQNVKTASKYNEGEGVEIWVLDTGIRPTHDDFGGRASIEYDAYGDDGKDCHGHGTHCAGTAGGAIFGVAKKATIKAVRILGNADRCDKSGTYGKVADGLDYVAMHAKKPAVVSMSVGGGSSYIMEQAVKNVHAEGIPVVVSAGNDNKPACEASPALLSEAITVGATTSDYEFDYRLSISNYGSCVDIFAPGTHITSAGHTSDTDTAIMSGTSMACPHVSGIAALYLAENPNLTPDEIKTKLRNSATPDLILSMDDNNSGSPNLLTYVPQY